MEEYLKKREYLGCLNLEGYTIEEAINRLAAWRIDHPHPCNLILQMTEDYGDGPNLSVFGERFENKKEYEERLAHIELSKKYRRMQFEKLKEEFGE